MLDTIKPVTYIIIKYITIFTAYYYIKYISLLHVIALYNNNIAVSYAPLTRATHAHTIMYLALLGFKSGVAP